MINNVYSDFKTQEIHLKLQKVSKLQSKISVEKRVIKHLYINLGKKNKYV